MTFISEYTDHTRIRLTSMEGDTGVEESELDIRPVLAEVADMEKVIRQADGMLGEVGSAFSGYSKSLSH